MGVIACTACGAAVNEEAAYCPSCGSDPRSGAPGPQTTGVVGDTVDRRARRAIGDSLIAGGRLPDADHRKVLRVRLLVAGATLSLLVGLGMLGFVWWPDFLATHTVWDEVTRSRDGRWQERDVTYGGFGPDSIGTTWVEVRRIGMRQWQPAYLDTSGEVAWKGDLVQVAQDNNDPSAATVTVTVDPRHTEGRRLLAVDLTTPVVVMLAVLAVGIWLVACLPRLLARRRVKALLKEALACLEEGDWARLAALCLAADSGEAAGTDLAAFLTNCRGTHLVPGRRRNLVGLRRREQVAPSAWCATVRISRARSEPQWLSDLLVVATASEWRLVPEFGLLAHADDAVEVLPWSRRPNGSTVAALVVGLLACAIGIVPFFGLAAGVVGPVAVVLAVGGLKALRRRGGPAYLAGVAVGLGSLAVLVAIGQAVFWWTLFALPTTTFFG